MSCTPHRLNVSVIKLFNLFHFSSIGLLSGEDLRTLSSLYELVCHLVHLGTQFLSQFCDAIAILGADEIFSYFVATVTEDKTKVRLVNSVIAILCCAIRELPENAELVEKIIFNKHVNIVSLLRHSDCLLRSRMCMLLRLIGRFSCRALQINWSTTIRETMEALVCDSSSTVRNVSIIIIINSIRK